MIEKYGKPGSTDNEGFNPYTDSVGPGIYGGIVKRDHEGQIEIGEQYQGHNPMPGPVYAGKLPLHHDYHYRSYYSNHTNT